MASNDYKRREVIDLVGKLVRRRFGGDFRKAFNAYDGDEDGKISVPELVAILYDAEIGNRLTRWAWCKAIVEEMDSNGDGLISWDEFQKALNSSTSSH